MSVASIESEERPCLHCAFLDLIDEFFAEYKAESGEAEIDSTEVLEAVAKTVAEFTARQDGAGRQKTIEWLMKAIMRYDDEFRQENEAGSFARH